MGAELYRFAKTGWQREPVLFISIIGGFGSPLIFVMLPSTQDRFRDIRSFPKEYPWPENADERRKPTLELKFKKHEDPVRDYIQYQFKDDLF